MICVCSLASSVFAQKLANHHCVSRGFLESFPVPVTRSQYSSSWFTAGRQPVPHATSQGFALSLFAAKVLNFSGSVDKHVTAEGIVGDSAADPRASIENV